MIEAIKKLLGIKTVNYAELMKEGAVILDVRTPGEYATGHIKGSLNIPVDSLGRNLNKLKQKDKHIITCCASGMRSAAAKNLLRSSGYTSVHNGGAWHSLKAKLQA